MQIQELWYSADSDAWDRALKRYWDFVKAGNMALEKAMENLDLDRLRKMDEQGWYDFLHNEYFRWKYTSPNRYATTTAQLQRYKNNGGLSELDGIRKLLLRLDTKDVRGGLKTAKRIHGLGVPGASGLLALMYPHALATVDQFVVNALKRVPKLPKAESVRDMDADDLKIEDGVILIEIMQAKARDNNRLFATTTWTPRKIDQVLWTYGR